MNIEELRNDIAIEQKKGLPFILASVIIWTLILIVTCLTLPLMALIVGHIFSSSILAGIFVVTEIIFSIVLALEVKKMERV